MWRQLVLFCFVLTGFTIHAPAQTGSPLFRHYTTEDGLPSSETYFVFEDSKGYMWFATDHGVVQYNGYEFRTFTTKDGLSDNTVFKLFEDRKGRIWILTFSSKLFYFEIVKAIQNSKKKLFSYKRIFSLFNFLTLQRQQYLWVD